VLQFFSLIPDSLGSVYCDKNLKIRRFRIREKHVMNSLKDPNWELRSEAFEPRINLNIELSDHGNGQNFGGDDFGNGSGGGNDNDSNGTGNEAAGVGNTIDDHQNNSINAGQTVEVPDQTSKLLCMESALERPAWSATPVLRNTLIHFAETGDVQTAISSMFFFSFIRLQQSQSVAIPHNHLKS
jgi:hypothetical protein